MWFDNRLRFNGAFFIEKWSNFQFSYLGPNALTIITNAGQAEIKGLETDLEFAVTQNLTLFGGFTALDAKLTQNFCGDPTMCAVPGYEQLAPVRHPAAGHAEVQGQFDGALYLPGRQLQGRHPGFRALCGLAHGRFARAGASGFRRRTRVFRCRFFGGTWKCKSMHYQLYINNALDKRAVLNRYAECDVTKCGAIAIYDVPNQPRTIGVKFGQKF